uniref:Uncharacterized protein LOC113787698 n=1 Tax=Cicer arietinum TaxID=3827 RepID=A0A3Q7YDP1_CICAR|nr:uncharacterized protein LOC113787698 [Cicer arietinum]
MLTEQVLILTYLFASLWLPAAAFAAGSTITTIFIVFPQFCPFLHCYSCANTSCTFSSENHCPKPPHNPLASMTMLFPSSTDTACAVRHVHLLYVWVPCASTKSARAPVSDNHILSWLSRMPLCHLLRVFSSFGWAAAVRTWFQGKCAICSENPRIFPPTIYPIETLFPHMNHISGVFYSHR